LAVSTLPLNAAKGMFGYSFRNLGRSPMSNSNFIHRVLRAIAGRDYKEEMAIVGRGPYN